MQPTFDILLEAALSDISKASIDSIIADLNKYRDADFGNLPGGYHAGEHYLSSIQSAMDSMKRYGKTAADIQKQEKLKQEMNKTEQLRTQHIGSVKQLCQQLVEQFPRYAMCLTHEFQIVQPNGELYGIEYGSITEEIIQQIAKFFRLPVYNELANKVQDLRDFGFNISAKLLNTDGGTFRTRYAIITNVLTNYEGPWLDVKQAWSQQLDKQVMTIQVENIERPGSAKLKVKYYKPDLQYNDPNSTKNGVESIDLKSVTLDHIGEIIDTIDIVAHATMGTSMISDVLLMGTQTVEYEITVELQKVAYTQVTSHTLNIPSSDIKNVKDITTKLYDFIKQQYRALT